MQNYIKVDNTQIWTEKWGKGVPVILISGGPGCCNYMEPVAEIIGDTSEVIMFDPRGCGRSLFDGEGHDLETALKDLETIRTEYGVDKWVVIGHSWGADLGLAYVLRHSGSILGFISMCGTGIQNDRDWKESYKRNKAQIGELLPEFAYEPNKIVHRSLIDSWRAFIKQPSLLRDISELDLPTLFVFAEKDIRPSWPIQQLSFLMKNSRYIELEGAEHYIWQTKQDELAEVLREFIKRINYTKVKPMIK
ncbi:proline iminopeptidase [Bacillus tianshenii]|uniref:Proline iminopeptidase n=1 Tax=Sutcliffiella tianshenii TaxID=1463404 RepID=A0ABS2NXE9_9BACI|nr:alpha/beta hydrolase [Bacillus tianshenii]MBM7619335.1 proline iminopeptidase [Bacillus tianshenii]